MLWKGKVKERKKEKIYMVKVGFQINHVNVSKTRSRDHIIFYELKLPRKKTQRFKRRTKLKGAIVAMGIILSK